MANTAFGDTPVIKPLCGDGSWYAVFTRSRQEKIAASMLESLMVPNFLPLLKQERQWSDRKQMVSKPLFPSYLFVRIVPLAEPLMRVMKVPGVVDFVRNRQGPVAIPNLEVESVRAVAAQDCGWALHPFLRAGDRVRVVRGALAGIEGFLLRSGARFKVIVSVELLQRSVAVTVDSSDIEFLHEESCVPQNWQHLCGLQGTRSDKEESSR